MFTDFAHPSTIAVLLVEAALFGLAFAAVFLGIPVRPVRWLARGLAAFTLLLGLGFGAGMILELLTTDLPLVVPQAPLGTYAQMTQLGLLLGALTFALTAVGSALSFRTPRVGGWLLVLAGSLGLLDEARKRMQDPSLPEPSFIFGVVLLILVLAVGALALAIGRSEHTPSTPRPVLSERSAA
jgi:hypothetical protein